MRIITLSSLVLSIACLNVSCKPAGSQLQSLDELGSNGALKDKACVGSNPVPASELNNVIVQIAPPNGQIPEKTMSCTEIAKDPNSATAGKFLNYCEAVKSSLSALKPNFRSLYFGKYNFAVKLSAQTNAICSEPFSDQRSQEFAPEAERRKISGCYTFGRVNGKFTLAVQLPLDKELINRNTVRIFGMFVSQALPKISLVNGAPDFSSKTKDVTAMKTYKYGVGENFLKDLYDLELHPEKASADGRSFKLSNLNDLVGENNIKDLREDLQNKRSLSERFDKMLTSSPVNLQRFLDTAMGEAFDSGTCGGEAMKNANKLFPNTLAYFRETTAVGLDGFINTALNTPSASRSLALSDDSAKADEPSFGFQASFMSVLQMALMQGYNPAAMMGNGMIGAPGTLGTMATPYLGSSTLGGMPYGLGSFGTSSFNQNNLFAGLTGVPASNVGSDDSEPCGAGGTCSSPSGGCSGGTCTA